MFFSFWSKYKLINTCLLEGYIIHTNTHTYIYTYIFIHVQKGYDSPSSYGGLVRFKNQTHGHAIS